MNKHAMSERRACRLIGLSRSTMRYRPRQQGVDEAITQRLMELARKRPRYGYRRLHAMLEREGRRVNHKRIYRLYKEAKLSLRRKRRRRWERIGPGPAAVPTRPNERWSMDFVSDNLANGQGLRVLVIVDDFTRECVAMEADTSLSGLRVCRPLEMAVGHAAGPHQLWWTTGRSFAVGYWRPGANTQASRCDS